MKEDADGDGWSVEQGDCDDDDPTVNPTAAEVWYDNEDQNCDGNDDDQDNDGVALEGDCDDTDSSVYPGAQEVCDDLDNDCNGDVDDDAIDVGTGYLDADGDGYGDGDAPVELCGDPEDGVVEDGTDCDDADPDVFPGAAEVCNEVDDDCDGYVDEAEGAPGSWYLDQDADGYGDPDLATAACTQPEGYAATGDDCDDADPSVNPGATEYCDDFDWNCDGDASAGAADAFHYYSDADGDTYGDDSTELESCTETEGWVELGGDCDDADAGVNPGAVEVCNGVDDDCEGSADADAIDAATWYTDADGDGFGVDVYGAACDQPAGTAAVDGDCDDANAAAWPGATEVCDSADNDCDGASDDPTASGTTYTDADGDGYGDASTAVAWECVPPGDGVDNGEDCDDGDGAVNPGATESCNEVDDDCDGEVDDAPSDGLSWHPDADGDGFGEEGDTVVACADPGGHVTDDSDCDDGDAAVNPDATEACNGFDDDCDGEADESGASGESTWYPDEDGDGYGADDAAVDACDAPDAHIAEGGDCDDARADVNPDATEVCDHVDNDCSGDFDDESGAGWVDASGSWTDIETELRAGRSSDPVVIGDVSTYDLVISEGTIHLCEGDWYLKVLGSTSGTSIDVVGSGAELTSISSGGDVSGTAGSIITASNTTINLTDLTVKGGIGSSAGKGGAIIASQSSATPSSPNVTLTRVVVSGNSATYGGGIALNYYGWISLVDSLVTGNEASYGGGLYISEAGRVSCSVTSLGAGGFTGNVADSGGGVYFASSTLGAMASTGCDWGEGDADNDLYDVVVGSRSYCYADASSVSTSVACSGGACTTSSDSCP